MNSQQIIFENANIVIYYLPVSNYDKPVLIKILKDDYPDEKTVSQFQNEYEITKNLQIEGVRKALGCEKIDGKHALNLEYFEGETIKEAFVKKKRTLSEFLQVAIQIAKALYQIHQHNIIHKDINSNNILVCFDKKKPATKSISKDEIGIDTENFPQVKIIDFGIASKFNIKTKNLGNPEKLEGTLAYISPEQTGRMNRMVDYRTDLYSLGIMLYEMLSRQLPFTYKDSMELVHAHIAKMPEPVDTLYSGTPDEEAIVKVLSQIIQKLISKNAEDRYQSAFGLLSDLEICYNALFEIGKLHAFSLGKNDFSGKFYIPQKLYGRDEEINVFLQTFERVCWGSLELTTIGGYPGTGKSVLVNEIHKPITEKRGYFIQGKFSPFQRDIPYYGLIQGFREFVNLLLTENQDQLQTWKDKILHAVGSVGKVLTDLIPNLELIVGRQPEVPELGGMEAQNRFNYVFRNFVKAIARPQHPIVLFIDDLQWADAASLSLLKVLLTDKDSKYFYIICAYRSNEVGQNHPFSILLHELEREEINKQEIILGNLKTEDVNQLIADSLHDEKENVLELSELVYRKTQGNAFFVNQFLKSLNEDNLLYFDHTMHKWKWNIDLINKKNITDNVVELLSDKVKKLDEKTQTVLQIAACIGNRFKSKTLFEIFEDETLKQIEKNLEPALIEGLIEPSGEFYKFTHDRIQQAVYSLIEEEEIKQVHKQIGLILLKSIPEEEHEERIFDIVNQLNLGSELFQKAEDKIILANLNLQAGIKAKSSAAYKPAYNYLNAGIAQLPDEKWTKHYTLSLDLHTNAAEMAYLTGQFDKTEELISVVLKNARKLLDKVKIYEVRILSLSAQNRLLEAVQSGLEILAQLGVKLPLRPTNFQILTGLIKSRFVLLGKKIEHLIDLPEMTDEKKLAAMNIISSMNSPVYLAVPELIALMGITQVNLSVRYGNAPPSPVAYSAYGLILCGLLENFKDGNRFGELAMKLINRTDERQFMAKTYFIYHSMENHWVSHTRVINKALRETYQIGLETGDLEYVGLTLCNLTFYTYYSGKNLKTFEEEIKNYSETAREIKQEVSLSWLRMFRQAVTNLIQPTEKPHYLLGSFYNEDEMLQRHIDGNDQSGLFLLNHNKAILSFMFGKYSEAFKNAAEAKKYISNAISTHHIPIFHYYEALIKIAYYREVKNDEKILRQAKKNIRKIKKWAKYGPMNLLHKYYLLLAELSRLNDVEVETAEYYNKAIDLAHKNEYANDEAIAFELCGQYHVEKKQKRRARYNLQNSYRAYLRWGADAKAEHLISKYPDMISPQSDSSIVTTSSSISISSNRKTVSSLDLDSIINASQTLSGEISLNKLLDKLMQIVVENAGAERGLLLLPQDNEWIVQAETDINSDDVKIMQEIPVFGEKASSNLLCTSIVNYTIRTREIVVQNNAFDDGKYSNDIYIKHNKILSLLCMPLLNQGKLTGILYFENNLTTDAFTPRRIEILSLLSSQLAISIENAVLYENLEQRVIERTEKLRITMKELKQKNRDITESINYAKRIQQAMLPGIEQIKKKFNDLFVIFMPRDIVSGDFYWFAETTPHDNQNKKQIIAVVDCTGHGVPGAFMSLVGNGLLNQIVHERGIVSPEQALKILHHGIRNALKQWETQNHDGMDIALCVIDKKERTLEFAGAYSPLIYVKDNEVVRIKGNSFPIGGMQIRKKREYKKHKIHYDEGTPFYIYSDGFQDQLGGPSNRKFMRRRLYNIFLENHKKPMSDQKLILENAFNRWKGKQRQIDDVLIIGFKP